MQLRTFATAALMATALATTPQAALGDHNACGSGHGFQQNIPPAEASTGTTDGFDTVDWWLDHSEAVEETFRVITLTPLTGDTDLRVWSGDCSALICASSAGAGTPDVCAIDGRGDTYVEAVNYGGTSSQYVLTVAYSPFFIR